MLFSLLDVPRRIPRCLLIDAPRYHFNVQQLHIRRSHPYSSLQEHIRSFGALVLIPLILLNNRCSAIHKKAAIFGQNAALKTFQIRAGLYPH
jgi:hypothetical protein